MILQIGRVLISDDKSTVVMTLTLIREEVEDDGDMQVIGGRDTPHVQGGV